MEKSQITKRQKNILKIITEKYIETNLAISSLNIKNDNLNSLSSATIRNEMVVLENLGYLKKENFSSGRVPTNLAYKLYIEFLMEDWKIKDITIKKNLIEIFSQRHESIDVTIDKSVELISNFLNLPIICTKEKIFEKELLKKIDITKIEENNYIIYIVTSSGEIYKNHIVINEFKEREDLNIAVQLLNEKLLDCPILELNKKIIEITPLLQKKVHKYEFIYSNLIMKIINKISENTQPTTKIYNTKSIIFQPEVKNNSINVNEIFELLENQSTFSQIKFNYLKTGNTLINLENEVKGLSIASTVLNLEKNTHKLSIIGPTRMNYPLIKYLLEFINEKLISKKNN